MTDCVEMLTEAELIRQVEGIAGSTVTETLSGGGSPARCYKVETRSRTTVFKVHSNLAGSVDGHDHLSLLRKFRQIQWLNAQRPSAGRLFVQMKLRVATAALCVVEMPYVTFTSAAEMRVNAEELSVTWHKAMESLWDCGWSQSWSEAPLRLTTEFIQIRIRNREQYLQDKLSQQDLVVSAVNGEVLNASSPGAAVSHLLQSLRGPWSSVVNIHGDLNLGNLWRTPEGLRLSDPRGYIGRIDPLYDIGKALFSACSFEACQEGAFDVTGSGSDVELSIGTDALEVPAAIAAIMEATSASSVGNMLERSVPQWRYRLCIMVAVHAICESACRFSCGASVSSREAAQFERDKARALWHYGKLLLHRCAKGSDRQMRDSDVVKVLCV